MRAYLARYASLSHGITSDLRGRGCGGEPYLNVAAKGGISSPSTGRDLRLKDWILVDDAERGATRLAASSIIHDRSDIGE